MNPVNIILPLVLPAGINVYCEYYDQLESTTIIATYLKVIVIAGIEIALVQINLVMESESFCVSRLLHT